MLANTIIELQLFEFYDTRNLTAIFKDNLVNEYFTSKLKVRLLNQYDELNNIVEAGQDAFNFLTSIDNSTLYCETIDFKLAGIVGTDKKAHWYITKVEQSEDGGVYLFLKRDTLRDFYSLYSGDSIIVKTETLPSSKTSYNGQGIYYRDINLDSFVKRTFPYMFYNNTSADWATAGAMLFIIDIISNDAQETKNSVNAIIDGNIGQTSYIMSYSSLCGLIKEISNTSFWEDLNNKIAGLDLPAMINRVAIAPFELTGTSIPTATVNEEVVGKIPIAKNSNIYVKPATAVQYLTRRRLYTPKSTSTATANGYTPIGTDILITYDVNDTEKLEVTLPFINKVDLTGYAEYFNGAFRIQYVIDSLTGNGFVGFTGNTDADYTQGVSPEYAVTIPFNCYRNINWVGVKGNQVEQAYGALTSLAGVIAGGSVLGGATGVASSLLRGNTQVIQRSGDLSLDSFTRLLAGDGLQYGVRITRRYKGVVNNGFKHTLQQFSTLTSVATIPQPTSNYNIITVDIAKRSWTGNDAIDNDIYTKLTQGGFVFNG